MTARPTDPTTREELYDTADEVAMPGRLGYYLKLCGDRLWPLFQRADAEALAYQSRYRAMSAAVTLLGTVAVLLGCAELIRPQWAGTLTWVDGILAVLAAIGVLIGLGKKLHRSWLASRYRAERLRLLKFSAFADPGVWQERGHGANWESAFEQSLDEIEGIEADELESISHHERIPDLPSEAPAKAVPDETRRALAVYYRIKRLEPQIDYFHARARRVRSLDNPVLLPLVFFGSLGIVLAHFGLTIVRRVVGLHEAAGLDRIGDLLIGLSLALPVAWAGVRTYRSANEFARNRSRSLARESALRQIAKRLAEEPSPQALFASIALAEYILAADQHEWLRLMLDAEWYG